MSNKHKAICSRFLIPFLFSLEFSWAFLSIALGIPLLVYGLFSLGGVVCAGLLEQGVN